MILIWNGINVVTVIDIRWYKMDYKHLPASTNILHSIQAVTDVNSLGLHITQFPAAIAGAILNVNKYKGRFHGVICPTTPTGDRTV